MRTVVRSFAMRLSGPPAGRRVRGTYAPHEAKEASDRSTCKNNLKQIGLALHNYHDRYHSLERFTRTLRIRINMPTAVAQMDRDRSARRSLVATRRIERRTRLGRLGPIDCRWHILPGKKRGASGRPWPQGNQHDCSGADGRTPDTAGGARTLPSRWHPSWPVRHARLPLSCRWHAYPGTKVPPRRPCQPVQSSRQRPVRQNPEWVRIPERVTWLGGL
jgi:hypothetical protein